MTDSDEERIRRGNLPGYEAMFKAEGNIVAKRLQDFVDHCGTTFKVSVVTGPSGSYKEQDILNFLDKWCEPWNPDTRRWEFILLDAYGPGLTDNVQRLCWKKGYIVVTHGGGASMVCQTNDVAHHKDVRKDFIDLQTEMLVHKARGQGGLRGSGVVVAVPVQHSFDCRPRAAVAVSLQLYSFAVPFPR